MAFTYGALSGDDLSAAIIGATPGSQNWTFFAGWFYFTTLTATRKLWGNTSTYLSIDTTTSELRHVANLTTDDIRRTSGAGLTTDKWWFIAHIMASSSAVHEPMVWIGDIMTPPVQQAWSITTDGSGGATSNSNVAIGNGASSGAFAVQGMVGPWVHRNFATYGAEFGDQQSIGTVTPGQTQWDYTYQRVVLPVWRGDGWNHFTRPHGVAGHLYESMMQGTPYVLTRDVVHSATLSTTWTANGITPALGRSDRPQIRCLGTDQQYVRR